MRGYLVVLSRTLTMWFTLVNFYVSHLKKPKQHPGPLKDSSHIHAVRVALM